MTTFARPSTPFPHAQSLSYASSPASYFTPMPAFAPIAEASSSAFASSSSSSSRRFSRPLHFTLPALPSRTPPSLLKRSASSASSSSTSADERDAQRDSKVARAYSPVQTASTPSLVERRTSSSSSASSSSSSEAESPATPPRSMHLALPRQASSPYFTKSTSSAPQAQSRPTYAAWPEFEALDDTPLTAVELLTDDAYDLAVSQAADFYTSASAPHPSPLALHSPVPLHQHQTKQSSPKRTASPTRPKFKRRDTPRPVETISTLASISLSYEGRKGLVQIEEQAARRYTSIVDGRQWVVVA